jgi:hypothetical protein
LGDLRSWIDIESGHTRLIRGGFKMATKYSGKSAYYWVTLVVVIIAFTSVVATAQV